MAGRSSTAVQIPGTCGCAITHTARSRAAGRSGCDKSRSSLSTKALWLAVVGWRLRGPWRGCSLVVLGTLWRGSLSPVRQRVRVVNQTSDSLQVGAAAAGPAEVPQLSGRPVVLVQSGVHLFGVTIGAVTIERGTDMFDESAQTRLVVHGDVFLGVAVCAAHAVDANARRSKRPPMVSAGLSIDDPRSTQDEDTNAGNSDLAALLLLGAHLVEADCGDDGERSQHAAKSWA